jgi:hypothetical protein
MKAIELAYDSLLADVANLSGYSEIRGPWWTLQWCIYDAPKLEKHVLKCTETGESLDLQLVPIQLKRLALGSMKDPIQMRYLRQLLLFCYKAHVTHDNQILQKSFEQFAQTNQAVHETSGLYASRSPVLLDRVRAHCQSVLSRFREDGLKPSHGPGSTTTSKSRWERWYHQIETVYPYSDWYSLYYNSEHAAEYGSKDPYEGHIQAKLIAVPKDSRGPRLICVHPAEAIWLQQGLRRELERVISLQRYRTRSDSDLLTSDARANRSSSDPCGLFRSVPTPERKVGGALPLTLTNQSSPGLRPQRIRPTCRKTVKSNRMGGPWPHGHVHFDDQTVNGKIALLSSRSRRYATLDMKEASDRISEVLVQILFGRKYKYFGCCRAQTYRIPTCEDSSAREGHLYCYAPMGNATTFPVQSLVFWAICVASMQHHNYHQPGAVFVFGDDIIVPSECAEFVINDLESFGLLVNKEKSFWRGSFRESCGVDAFNGVNVTPVRWKTTIDAEHLEGMQSLSDIAMRLRTAGYETAAATCYAILRRRMLKIYRVDLSYTNNRDHGGIAEYTTCDSNAFEDAYWHPHLQWYVTRVWRLKASPHKKRRSCGWNHVLESVLSLERTGHSSIPDRSALRRTRLVRGWIQVS